MRTRTWRRGGINEGTESVTPEVKVEVRSDALSIYRALAGGVTALNVLHGSANAVGGQGAIVKLRWGEPSEKTCCSRVRLAS